MATRDRERHLPCLFQRLTGLAPDELASSGVHAAGRASYVRPRQSERADDARASDEPRRARRTYLTGPLDSRQYLDAVRADLERLLNATASTPPIFDDDDEPDLPEDQRPPYLGFPEIQKSVLNYGLGGLSGMIADRVRVSMLERCVRWAIEHFEPRVQLQSVRAATDDDKRDGRTVRIEIRGRLRADPVPLHLVTEFDCQTGRCAVSEA